MVHRHDKKAEKREMDKAAVARNQLFGEAQKAAASKDTQMAKHSKE